MSLISRLFVFVALWGFTICYFILCFILGNSWVTYPYSLGNTIFFQKRSFFSHSCQKTGIKIIHTTESRLQFYRELQKHLKSTLQNRQYSKKHLIYVLKELKSSLYNLKRNRKPLKALEKYPVNLLFSIFLVCYCLFFNPNLTL
jgi:hypothetical protein